MNLLYLVVWLGAYRGSPFLRIRQFQAFLSPSAFPKEEMTVLKKTRRAAPILEYEFYHDFDGRLR